MNQVIRAAIKAGYRHIDTAKVYATEPLIGPVLSDMIKNDEIKREEVFITCKVNKRFVTCKMKSAELLMSGASRQVLLIIHGR